MIAHDPSLVILSVTIAILGAFTASVMTSNIYDLSSGERRMRIVMAALTLGGALWATHFVGLLSLEAPVNFTYNPILTAASAVAAFMGTAVSLFILWPSREGNSRIRFSAAVALFGATIAATHYSGLAAIAGQGLRLGWFLTAISIALAIQAALMMLAFLCWRRGVIVTLIGAVLLGVSLAATHYASIAGTHGLEETLFAVPRSTSKISERYLAWAAAIMMYLLCSICLSVFVIMQFREDIE
jgi:NO-binding membrane sensor protein with MHYT domain